MAVTEAVTLALPSSLISADKEKNKKTIHDTNQCL